jgi:PhnB protein
MKKKKAGSSAIKKSPEKKAGKKNDLSKVSFIPAGYSPVMVYITVSRATQAIDFYKKAFGARERGRITMPDGKIGHAEIVVNGSVIMLADEMPDWGNKSPETLGGSPAGICLYVRNVDAFFKKALAVGARLMKPVEDQFYGDRSGTLVDPFGHQWTIATHKEDVSFKQMQKRTEEMLKK